jgi:hypothetical protein
MSKLFLCALFGAALAGQTAGDHNVEFFDQISPQTSDKEACQYHPDPAENQLRGTQIVTELRARLGW